MSAYTDMLEAIRKARAERDGDARALYAAQLRHLALRKQLRTERRHDDDDDGDPLAESKQRVERLAGVAREARGRVSSHIAELFRNATPQELIANWSDRYPIALFPLRLETKFQSIGGKHELWVRVFPDDIAVVTHEETLTETEIRYGVAYWKALLAAGDGEEAKKTAWRMLADKLGANRAAWVALRTKPTNWGDGQIAGPDDLVFPSFELIKAASWTEAPHTRILPDRFVLLAYRADEPMKPVVGNPVDDVLILGPAPIADADVDQPSITRDPTHNRLSYGPELQWLIDFPTAVAKGMGFRIPLDAATAAQGFDQLLVVGLKLSADETDGKRLVEDLIDNHHYSKAGFALLPQGTPTNNTDEQDVGYSSKDPLQDASYVVETGAPLFAPTDEPDRASDGQRLAEYLGIDYAPLQYVAHAGARDHAEALAMNRALFAGTLGYYLNSLLNEVMTEQTLGKVRHHFNHHVTGRGPIAAIRVGNQPYGILPASSFPAWKVTAGRPGLAVAGDDFLPGLHRVLAYLDGLWRALVPKLAHIGKQQNAGATLMSVLGLCPTSVEYFQRVGYSLDYLKNLEAFQDDGKYIWDVYKAQWAQFVIPQLLKQLGYRPLRDNGTAKPIPLVLQLIFRHYHTRLDVKNLIDGQPPSEAAGIKPYDEARELNYIHWLLDTTDSNKLEAEDFGGAARPTSLLYMLLRYSLLHETGTSIFKFLRKFEIDAPELIRSRKFANLSASPTVSPWEVFQLPTREVVAAEATSQPLFAYLHSARFSSPSDTDVVANLAEHKRALGVLKDLPTARLERAFAEHVDVLTYRLDAWQTSLFDLRLRELRGLGGGTEQRSTGILVGAYGYLENVRPSPARRTRVTEDVLPAALREGKDNLFVATGNGGYVHAPSLNHATAAAILRSGYLTHAGAQDGDLLAVNLSSERVRRAHYLVEGVRHGQTLEVLLGYQFERGLHDWSTRETDPVILNHLVPYFRKAFPIKRTRVPQTGKTTGPEETVEDFHVVNGLELARTTAPFPYGISFPSLTASQIDALRQEKRDIENTLDAMRDLLTSESAYQLALGNFERAAGVMQAMSAGQMPPEIEIVHTARGTNLAFTHRMMIHLDAAVAGSPWPGPPMKARARTEPALNAWVGALLGDPTTIRCWVKAVDVDGDVLRRADGSPIAGLVTLAELALQPLDFMYLIRNKLEASGTAELEARVRHRFARAHGVADDVVVSMEFANAQPAADRRIRSFAEVLPLADRVRDLVCGSRPLGARSYQIASRTASAPPDNPEGIEVAELRLRVVDIHAELAPLLGQLATDITAVEAAATLATVDQLRARLKAIADSGYAFAFPQSAVGFAAPAVETLLAQARSVGKRFAAVEARYQANLLLADAATTKPDQKVALLTEMARAMLGDDYQLIPRFRFPDPSEIAQSHADRDQLLAYATGTLEMALPVDEWLHGVAQVRPKMHSFEMIRLLHDAQHDLPLEAFPLQLPYRPDDSWLGVQFPPGTQLLHDTLSLVIHAPQGFDPTAPQCGLLVDDWTESVPNREEVTGLAFNFDNPNSAPPQVVLLAVTPELTGRWTWDHLIACIRDTFARAKARAVEPDLLDQHGVVTTLLPLLITEFSTGRTTVSLDHSLNIEAVAKAVAGLAILEK